LNPNTKTYKEGGRNITFEELPCFELEFHLGFHVHLRTVFQWQRWFGHLSGFGNKGGMPKVHRNLENAVGGRLYKDQPQSTLRLYSYVTIDVG
jgi:hypothetical protein